MINLVDRSLIVSDLLRATTEAKPIHFLLIARGKSINRPRKTWLLMSTYVSDAINSKTGKTQTAFFEDGLKTELCDIYRVEDADQVELQRGKSR